MKLNQKGFHVVEAVIVLLVIGAIGFVGWRVVNKDKSSSSGTANSEQKAAEEEKLEYVEWSWGGDKWLAITDDNKAPECPNPLTIKSPMKVDEATDVLYPGQIRGGDFKPHGGLGSEKAEGNKVKVTAPISGYVFRAGRYLAEGEVQYTFDMIHPCGIMYRLGHLRTLTGEFQKIADKLPEAKENDSRTTKLDEPVLVRQGTEIATAVGIINSNNAFFDFGVYDLRQPNEASKTALYKSDQQRIQDQEQSFYALCWFDLLTGDEKTKIKSLPPRGSEGTTSDYCQ